MRLEASRPQSGRLHPSRRRHSASKTRVNALMAPPQDEAEIEHRVKGGYGTRARSRVVTPACPRPITLYVDADACPVKQEIYRVAERFVARKTTLKVVVVANAPIAVPRADFIERVVVGSGMDEADNFIAERVEARRRRDHRRCAARGSRAVKAGAEVIAPNGRPFA